MAGRMESANRRGTLPARTAQVGRGGILDPALPRRGPRLRVASERSQVRRHRQLRLKPGGRPRSQRSVAGDDGAKNGGPQSQRCRRWAMAPSRGGTG